MQQVLAIPELFSLIALACTDSPSSLASLARTCRLFSEPSLNALYGSATVDLRDVAALPLAVKHQKLFEAGSRKPPRTYLNYPNEGVSMDSKTWERFDYYAVKIKNLKVTFDKVADEVFITLSSKSQIHHLLHAGHPVLFPRLSSLEICDFETYTEGKEHPYAFAVLPFLSPSLTKLTIATGNGYVEGFYIPGIRTLAPLISDFCPNLESLIIHCPDEYDGDLSQGCEMLLACIVSRNKRLRILDANIHSILPSTIENILSLTNLEVLRLESSYEDLASAPRVRKPCLSSLNILKLNLQFEMVISAVKALDHPNLAEVSIDTFCYADVLNEECQIEGLLGMLFDNTNPLSMAKIDLSLYNDSIITLSSISPLLGFKNLQELKMCTEEMCLFDCDISILARALIHLRVLHFGTVSGLTLNCLEMLSCYCMRLEELRIAVDATNVPTSSGSKANTVFKKLTVCKSPIKDADAVGMFLRRIFPSISEVVDSTYRGNGGSKIEKRQRMSWELVSELLSI